MLCSLLLFFNNNLQSIFKLFSNLKIIEDRLTEQYIIERDAVQSLWPGRPHIRDVLLTPEQVKEKKEAIKKEKEEKVKRKMMRERAVELYKNRDYTFVNNNMYEVAVYWSFSNIPENERKERDRFIRAMYIPAMSQELYNFVGFIG